MGGYEAPAEASSRKKSEQLENLSSEAAPEGKKAVEELPRRGVEREVIREENLTQEDRAVIDREKRKFSAPTKASDPLGVKIAVKDVIAKKELIEEDDGVTIKGVVERIANPEATKWTSTRFTPTPPSLGCISAKTNSRSFLLRLKKMGCYSLFSCEKPRMAMRSLRVSAVGKRASS